LHASVFIDLSISPVKDIALFSVVNETGVVQASNILLGMQSYATKLQSPGDIPERYIYISKAQKRVMDRPL
jgi:hypothetical protein